MREPYYMGKVEVNATTDAAALCEMEDGEEDWIPFSQMEEASEINSQSSKGDEGELVITHWLAKQKGLVED